MGSSTDQMGARMKEYEAATRAVLPPRSWTIIRVDGRAFHTLLRGADKPFDFGFIAQMTQTAKELCRQASTARFAYSQSDEISLLLAPFGENTQPWFGGVVQKIASISASIATMAFNREGRYGNAMFDARVFTLPNAEEVHRYFEWRQADATRNSLSMLARANFSHKQLHGKRSSDMHEMLHTQRGINWNDLNPVAKRGQVIDKRTVVEDVEFVNKGTGEFELAKDVVRTYWVDSPAPIFAREPAWLDGRMA